MGATTHGVLPDRVLMARRWAESGGTVDGLVRIPLDSGGSLLVERVGGDPRGPVRAGQRGVVVAEATETLQQALDPIRRGARAVLDGLRDAAPDEIAVEFGITLTAETGAVIAKAGSECHLTVTLTWKPGEERDAPKGDENHLLTSNSLTPPVGDS